VSDGSVVAVGASGALPEHHVDLSDHVVLPGLVNAHVHLELSDLRGQVSPAVTMPAWAGQVIARARERSPDPDAIGHAITESRAAGTVLVGDISNTLASVQPLARSALCGVVFHELLGFDVSDGERVVAEARAEWPSIARSDVRLAFAAHAPYSVSPVLLSAISGVDPTRGGSPRSVHAGESREELEFLRSGDGPWRDVLLRLGRWNMAWAPPGDGPVDYLGRCGWMREDTLFVHGIHLTDAEIRRVADRGASIVTCPRSNRWTGAGVPPVARFYASGARVAIGTDSLASVDDLNLFSELLELRRLAPEVPASRLIETATRSGAEALGFGDRFGTIAPGRSASLIAVRASGGDRLPDTGADVEEWLVSGIQPAQVAWLDQCT
jgi:cytosine/adenosine deaminase-related metal-dependent hydrolase